MVDLDYTKLINDRYGHAEGDRYLKEAVLLLSRAVRVEDRIYRLGGDEFAVILAGPDEQAMPGVVARVKRYLAEEYEGPVPISMGVGWSSTAQVPGSDVLKAADQAMYRDKRARRRDAALPLA